MLYFEPRVAQPGERIIEAGEEAEHVYFISSGEVEVAKAANRIRLGPGEYFGEMALVSGQPRSADVTALDYSKFATLSRRDFLRFLEKHPGLREGVSDVIAERGRLNEEVTAKLAPDPPIVQPGT